MTKIMSATTVHRKKKSVNTLWYHGMSPEVWHAVQAEGVLFGYRGLDVSRCTYLTPDPVEALCYGVVLLEVQYNPVNRLGNRRRDRLGRLLNNYESGCWQMRVYEPIPLQQCCRIDIADFLP